MKNTKYHTVGTVPKLAKHISNCACDNEFYRVSNTNALDYLDDFSTIMFRALCFYCLQIIWLSYLLTLSVPDEGYSRNASCALN